MALTLRAGMHLIVDDKGVFREDNFHKVMATVMVKMTIPCSSTRSLLPPKPSANSLRRVTPLAGAALPGNRRPRNLR